MSRTALFYSCKGGGGRTLALANVASLLARLGYRVLCIDLDLEAPGLLEALGPRPADSGAGDDRAAADRGFVEYALDWLAHREANEGEDAGTSPIATAGEDPGRLNARPFWLLPNVTVVKAGNYYSAEGYAQYAGVMRAGYLESIYAPPPSGRSELDATEAKLIERYETFWRDLREELGAIDADYLLIDTRTGFSPLSATTVNAFLSKEGEAAEGSLDVFVFAERGSEASRLGTQEFMREFSKRSEGTLPEPHVTIVRREEILAEGPGEPERSREEWLLAGDEGAAWANGIQRFLRIRSDPKVERTGMNLSSRPGELEPCGLLDDYVELTARLVPSRSIAEIRAELGLPEPQRELDYKLFELPRGGGLVNITDAQPNISFTVNTFHLLVKALLDAESAADPRLAEIGAGAGEAFAANLVKRNPGDIRGAVKDWLTIDSSVGWGLFALSPPDIFDFSHALQAPGDERPPSVTVTNNLGFAPAAVAGWNLCSFLGGYIGGLLSELVGSTVTPSEHTRCHSKGDDRCEFVFKLKDSSEMSA